MNRIGKSTKSTSGDHAFRKNGLERFSEITGWLVDWAEGDEMSEPERGLASLGLDDAIRLRWALRDIHARRLKLSPVAPEDLRLLKEMRYIEIVADNPVITLLGMDEIGQSSPEGHAAVAAPANEVSQPVRVQSLKIRVSDRH